MLVRVKRAATSGRAVLRAAGSSLEDVTGVHVTFVFPCPQLLRIAHVGLDSIFNVLGLCLRVLNQGLQLPECADFSVSSFVLIAHSFP